MYGKSWFEDEPDGATWPGHHMAGGVAVPLKPKTIVWRKRPHVEDEDEQRSGQGHRDSRELSRVAIGVLAQERGR